MSAVELTNIVKTFGRVRALDDLSVTIPVGSLCAVVGPNGSGKTTLFSTIAGLLKPESGQLNLWGQGPYDAGNGQRRLSLMPQDSVPSAYSSVRRSLLFYAELQGLTRQQATVEVEHWLREVSLSERGSAKFSELSHGMKRRFSIAQAFLGKPELILLDEPTGGLDPEVAARMRNLFVSQRGRATLLISSHNLGELQAICDYIVILEKGQLVRQGSMASLLGVKRQVSVHLTGSPNWEGLREALPRAFELKWNAPVLVVRSPESVKPENANALILAALLAQKVGIVSVQAGQSLETSYLNTKGNGPEGSAVG